MKLTQRTIEGLTCPPDRKDALFFDDALPGFGVRVSAGGTKTFLAQYSVAGAKRRVAIGAFGVLTPDEARRAAKGVLGEAAQGGDPFVDRRAKAEAARAARTEQVFKFGDLVTDWAAARASDRRPGYLREAVGNLRRHLPDLLARPASSITTKDVIAALSRIKREAGTVTGNRALAYGSAAYSWAVRQERVPMNPFKGRERPGKETSRERVLTAEELGCLWRASLTLSPIAGGFVRTLLLTLGRRAEAASMRWTELDCAVAPTMWALPGERAKNGRQHRVHLSAAAREVIAAVPKVSGNAHVFPGRDGKAIAAFSAVKKQVDAALDAAGTPIEGWRFHDFRRAGVTVLSGMGFPPHVVDKLLNHETGTLSAVARIYNRQEYQAERAAALDAWASLIVAAAQGREPASNIVSLVRAA